MFKLAYKIIMMVLICRVPKNLQILLCLDMHLTYLLKIIFLNLQGSPVIFINSQGSENCGY